jgi:hypothetical protein
MSASDLWAPESAGSLPADVVEEVGLEAVTVG